MADGPVDRAGLAVVAMGLPLGVAAGAILSVSGLTMGIIGLRAAGLLVAGALIATLGKQPNHRSFQLRNLLLWTGAGVGGLVSAALLGGGPVPLTGLIVGWAIRGWITSSVLGSAAVLAIRRVVTPADSNPGSPTYDAAPPPRRLRTIARRMFDWLGRHLSRERRNIAIRRNRGVGGLPSGAKDLA